MDLGKFQSSKRAKLSTSISIVHDLTEKHKFSKGVMMMVMMKSDGDDEE